MPASGGGEAPAGRTEPATVGDRKGQSAGPAAPRAAPKGLPPSAPLPAIPAPPPPWCTNCHSPSAPRVAGVQALGGGRWGCGVARSLEAEGPPEAAAALARARARSARNRSPRQGAGPGARRSPLTQAAVRQSSVHLANLTASEGGLERAALAARGQHIQAGGRRTAPGR